MAFGNLTLDGDHMPYILLFLDLAGKGRFELGACLSSCRCIYAPWTSAAMEQNTTSLVLIYLGCLCMETYVIVIAVWFSVPTAKRGNIVEKEKRSEIGEDSIAILAPLMS